MTIRITKAITVGALGVALVIPAALLTPAQGAPTPPTAAAANQPAAIVLPTITKRKASKRAIKRSALADGKRPARKERSEPFVRQTACHHIPKPGVLDFQKTILEAFPRPEETLRTFNVLSYCAYPGSSEHSEGRAVDFEADYDDQLQRTQANELLRWLTKKNGFHAKRWGIMYIVWNQRIWATYNMRWRTMSDRGSKTHNHRDHIHFSFTWNGALKRSSYWSGRTRATHYGPCQKYRGEFAAYSRKFQARKCGSGGSTPKSWSGNTTTAIKPWDSGDRVTRLQQFLIDAGVLRGQPYGSFDVTTHKAVRKWQKRNGASKTGIWDRESQRKARNPIWPRSQTTVGGWNTADYQGVAGVLASDQIRVKSGSGYRARTLQVQRKLAGSGNWQVVTTATTASDGRYRVSVSPPAGDWRYRVAVQEDSRSFGAASGARKFKVVSGVLPPDAVTSQQAPSQESALEGVQILRPNRADEDSALLPGQSTVTGAEKGAFG